MDYANFTREWLKRAERTEGTLIDDADRFISLWIAFNGWLKNSYGEKLTDRELINKVKENTELIKTFNKLKEENESFKTDFSKLTWYNVMDMRDNITQAINCRTTGSFEEYIEVVYRVRCNLFHGRKNIEYSKEDYDLVILVYKTLLPLFKKHLKEIWYL